MNGTKAGRVSLNSLIDDECVIRWSVSPSMMEHGEVEPPRQYRHVAECVLDGKRVFSGYDEPTAVLRPEVGQSFEGDSRTRRDRTCCSL